MTGFEQDNNNLINGCGSNSVREGDMNLIEDQRRAQATSSVILVTKNLCSFTDSHKIFEGGRAGYANFGRLIITERDDGQLKKYVIGGVNEPEMYLRQGVHVISYLSPTGQLLLNAEPGEEIELPRGGTFTVLSVEDAPSPDSLDDYLAPLRGPQVTRSRLTPLHTEQPTTKVA